MRQSLYVDECDHGALLVGEIIERLLDGGVEHAAQRDPFGGVVGRGEGQVVQFNARVAQQVRTSVPSVVGRGVAQDGQQPRPRVCPVELVQGPVGADQGVLDQVFGVAELPGQGAGGTQQGGDVRDDVAPERSSRPSGRVWRTRCWARSSR